ncbi:MAG: sugar transferase [Acidimicrobiales bacterium]
MRAVVPSRTADDELDLTGLVATVSLRENPTYNHPPYIRVVGNGWQPPARFRYRGPRLLLKRGIDYGLALAGLIALAPVMLCIALAVRLTSRGPILFRQWRMGRHGSQFQVLKFRTMRLDSEERLLADPELYARYKANDFKLSIEEDPRITRIGRFLRRSSLDELPQLVNVLHGEMSLVGPRPVLRDELDLYGPWVEAYMAVFPGVTGRWQVEGRNNIRFPERAELDARYADEWTLRGDLSLIARTIPAVLRNEGVT